MVRLGEHNTETNPDCQGNYCNDPHRDFKISSIIYHKDFDTTSNLNDIALIKLDTRVKFSSE